MTRDRKISIADLPTYTVTEWEKWEGKWELIEGIAYAMAPMPSIKHQRINGKVYKQFDDLLENCAECEALLPVNFKIDKHNVLQELLRCFGTVGLGSLTWPQDRTTRQVSWPVQLLS